MRSDFVRNLVIIFVGIMLVFMNESSMPLLVRIVGVLFFVPAFISLAGLFFPRPAFTAAAVAFSALVNVGSMAFGLWLILSPGMFMGLFLKLIAVTLFLVSLYRLLFLFRLRANAAVSWKMGIVPFVVAIASVVLFVDPFAVASTVSILLGICAIFIGVADIFLLLFLDNRMHEPHSLKGD
ncbi:MAG: DUF308 domain-containing protein [Bacteroidaceae bacterium]|nr:DUF308 domain-containing protein [Bacteroidaceae bacterium]